MYNPVYLTLAVRDRAFSSKTHIGKLCAIRTSSAVSKTQLMLTVLATEGPGAARVGADQRGGIRDGDEVVLARERRAQRLAAQAGGAPRVGAHGGVGVGDLGVTVVTCHVSAERLAALGNPACVAFARHVHGVGNGGEAVRAFDGVAVLRLAPGREEGG